MRYIPFIAQSEHFPVCLVLISPHYIDFIDDDLGEVY